ncbi:hypothetical protein WN48_03677 [Eufriesea mexicana]|uniref:uncharacterized protein LOC108549590 n=1 Tax=Eufriesea mexicana TaxID=516756 RepID=UPI00083C2B94|nr:PREDICTED: uncharacterized protein LOC108549590 [Eufriesea mexicana]OAD56191.1 hypothetical protein WN48_03677 [Eufriesea mexicana]
METKSLIVIVLLLILTSDGTCFGRKRSVQCRREKEETLSKDDQNSTDSYNYICDRSEFGIVQKIPYFRPCSACDTIKIDFSTACIRCGMCLAIAEKINQTLLDVHEVLPNVYLNHTEIELLLRTICNHSFQHYGLQKLNGKRYISDRLPGSIMITTSADGLWGKKLSDLCHYYLDEIGEVFLYEQWQRWRHDNNFQDLITLVCRSTDGILRDCRSMENVAKYESPFKTYKAKVKITATYDKYGKRN